MSEDPALEGAQLSDEQLNHKLLCGSCGEAVLGKHMVWRDLGPWGVWVCADCTGAT